MRYGHEVYNSAKQLFIEQNLTYQEVAEHFDNRPTYTTIHAWANEVDPETGKTWHDLKKEYRDDQYNAISPQAIAGKILQQIQNLLSADTFTTKDADALAKLQKALQKITDPRYQIPVMYQMLGDYMKFLQKHYPALLSKEHIAAIRHFKNSLRKRLTDE